MNHKPLSFTLLHGNYVSIRNNGKMWITPVDALVKNLAIRVHKIVDNKAGKNILGWRFGCYAVTVSFPLSYGRAGCENLSYTFGPYTEKRAQSVEASILGGLTTEGALHFQTTQSGKSSRVHMFKVSLACLVLLTFGVSLLSTASLLEAVYLSQPRTVGMLSAPILNETFTESPSLSPAVSTEQASTASRVFSTKKIGTTGYLNEGEIKSIESVAARIGVVYSTGREERKSAIPFYVFSSLLCKTCASVDLMLPKVSADYIPIVIPAGIESNPTALYGINATYCSKTPDVTWTAFQSGTTMPYDYVNCEDWAEKAKASALITILLERDIKINQLPVIVAPNGAYRSAGLVSGTTAKDLAEWLKVNSKAPDADKN